MHNYADKIGGEVVMKYTNLSGILAAILMFVLGSSMAVAQDTRGRVQGAVVDPSGSAVPGVSVTLKNDATGVMVTRSTGETGRYLFDQVDQGHS